MGKFDEAKRLAEKKAADKQSAKKTDKAKGNRLVNFFRELRAELKRIIWPDKKKITQSTSIVIAIVLATALLIFAIDSIVNASLTAAGFYNTNPRVTTSATIAETSETEAVSESTASETPAATETTTAG